MQTIKDFISKLAEEPTVSPELDTLTNTLLAVTSSYEELANLMHGSNIVGGVTLDFNVTHDCMMEIFRISGETLHHPTASFPHWWIRVGAESTSFVLSFRTEDVDLFIKVGESFTQITK